jgi:hypothetical protein
VGLTNKLNPLHQNPKVHHCIHQRLPPAPILSKVNPFHTLPAYLPKIRPNPFLPSMPRSFKWSLSLGLSQQNPVHFSPLSYACHMPCPPPWFDLPNNIWWWVQVMKLPIVQLSPVTSSLLGASILLSTLFSNTVSLCSSLMLKTKFHTHTKQMAELWSCIF